MFETYVFFCKMFQEDNRPLHLKNGENCIGLFTSRYWTYCACYAFVTKTLDKCIKDNRSIDILLVEV